MFTDTLMRDYYVMAHLILHSMAAFISCRGLLCTERMSPINVNTAICMIRSGG